MSEQDQISIWRSKWGAVYKTKAKGIEFVFRPLTLEEIALINEGTEDEDVLKIALLSPQDLNYETTPAGVISAVAEEIAHVSSGDLDSIVEELAAAKDQLNHFHEQLKVVILAAFSSYTEEDLLTMTLPQLVHKAALAEEILGIRGHDVDLSVGPKEQPVPAPKPIRKDSIRDAMEQGFAAEPEPAPEPRQAMKYPDPIAAKLRKASIVEFGQ